MPIKLPKSFPRRKSSGNALEDSPNHPEPSFRVLERPPNSSFDGSDTLKRMSQMRPLGIGQSGPSHSSAGTNNNLNTNNRYATLSRYIDPLLMV